MTDTEWNAELHHLLGRNNLPVELLEYANVLFLLGHSPYIAAKRISKHVS